MGIVKELDVVNGGPRVHEVALSIIKKALTVAIQVANNPAMSKKNLEVFP
jgi:hypothetical protein